MNTSTNMALKTQTRCYSFDHSVRKCNDSLVLYMNKIVPGTRYYISGQSGFYCVTAAVLNILPTATARAGFTRCGAGTPDHQREAIRRLLLVLLLLWFGTRTHTRIVLLTSG